MKDEYGDEMVRLLMEAHGYTAKEAEKSLAGGEGNEEGCSVVVVVEHGERVERPQRTGAIATAVSGKAGAAAAGTCSWGRCRRGSRTEAA